MNLQMSLQNKTYWTPSLAVVKNIHQSNPRSSSKHLPLEGVLHTPYLVILLGGF